MNWMRLTISLLVVVITAAIGNLATTSSLHTWYSQLSKPIINPPDWVFAPVWTLLYALIGISLYLVWTSPVSANKRMAYIVYGMQLVLNALWSIVFFGFQLPWVGVAVIIVLLVSILGTIALFWSYSRIASFLLFPYALWVTFAMALTIGIATLN